MTIVWMLVRWVLVGMAGIVTAIALGWVGLAGRASVAVGPWTTSLAAGEAEAGIYNRTYVAITGLFALNRSETMYFSARRDDDAQLLQARCNYDLTGGPIGARWWSITAYADDNFLIANAANRYSYNSAVLGAAADGRYAIALGPRERPGNWLPTGDRPGGFNLLLRLYNPQPELANAPGRATLPSIKRAGACPP